MAFDEPVSPSEYKDLALLDSAANRPFQTFGQVDLYPSLSLKAAALFHSLACNHCFHNGNKRTAIMALDLFLIANEVVLLINNADIYALAKDTAAGTAQGRRPQEVLANVTTRIKAESVPLEVLKKHSHARVDLIEVCTHLENKGMKVRAHYLNTPNAASR